MTYLSGRRYRTTVRRRRTTSASQERKGMLKLKVFFILSRKLAKPPRFSC